MNQRIKKLRLELGLSQDEFAAKLGFTRGVIANIELNRTEPKPKFLELMCRIFNVDEYWLRTGEGEMFVKVSEDEELAAYVGHVLGGRDSDLQRSIISFMSKLPPETWEVIEAKAREVLNSRTETEKEEQT